MNKKKKTEKWKSNFLNRKEKRYSIDPENFADDFDEILDYFNSQLPAISQKNLNNILTQLNHIEAKSLKNNYLLPDTKRKQLADIIYKMNPEFIEQYIQIPKKIALTKTNNQGKNAVQLINENTKLLSNAVEKISDELFSENITKMSVQQKYANQKFNNDFRT